VQRVGLTQALGSIKRPLHITVLKFALTFIGIGAIALCFDQWQVYRHFGKINIVKGLIYGVEVLGILSVVASMSFFIGIIASRRKTNHLTPYISALAVMAIYLMISYTFQHTSYALLSMFVTAFFTPFFTGSGTTNAA